MANVIHGTGKPKIEYIKSSVTYTINLPYTQALTEEWREESIDKTFSDGDTGKTRKGYRYYATLNYQRYATKETVEAIEPLFDINRNFSFKFYPRGGSTLYYNVDLAPESVLTLQQRSFFKGHRGLILRFKGTERMTEIDLTTSA